MRILTDVAHLDVGNLSAPRRTDDGFLRADAYVTRTGVFTYRNPDGSKRREWRPPEEVFNADSLDTLRGLPVTDEHPPSLLSPENAKEFTCGSLGDQARRDGKLLAINMTVTDGDLIKKMDSNKSRQTSCGYRCDLEFTEGVTPEGERYDAVQRKIRYNHLAVLPRGRAGADVAVRMDAAELDVVLDLTPQPRSAPKMTTIHVDGIDFPADSPALSQAIAQLVKRHDAAITLEKKNREELQVKFDQADALGKKLAVELEAVKKDAAELPAKLKREMSARLELEATARKAIGPKVKLDGLSTRELQLKVIERLAPKAKMDGKTDEQIAARFDTELERFDADAGDDMEVEKTTDRADGDDERSDEEDERNHKRLDAEAERQKNIKGTEQMWKKPIGASLGEGRGLSIVKEVG